MNKIHNIAGLRERAKRRLPAPMFHYIDGGADDEWSLRRNISAFEDYELLPMQLRDVSNIDLSVSVLDTELKLPFFLSPTGMSGLFHHHKEPAAARAAHRHGTLYSLSTLASTSLEDVAAASPGPNMFQIYILKDRGLTQEFVERCKTSNYHALCLTVDTPVAGNRERDLVNGMTMPPKISLRNALSYASRWHWLYHTLTSPGFKLANVAHRVDALGAGAMGLIDYVNSQFDRTVSWDDVAWLAEQWQGPFVIKGLQSASDAVRAAEVGASAIMISNHGGRQLESAPAPIDCVAPMRDAVGDRLQLIVDGGIRRGNHIVKAMAAGADCCSVGRAYLFGLAAMGEAGVDRAIEILRDEIARTLALMGVQRIADLGSEQLIHRGVQSLSSTGTESWPR